MLRRSWDTRVHAGPCEGLVGEPCDATSSPRWYTGRISDEPRACCQACHVRSVALMGGARACLSHCLLDMQTV